MIISLMPDYSNGKIYKLVSDNTDMIYIGSTTIKLNKRLSEHKSQFKNNNNFVYSKKLFKLGENVSIELIKLFPCNCRKELEKEEGKYILEYKNICVNKYIAGRTIKEYMKKYNKKQWEDNKEKIKEKRKEKYKCICGSEFIKIHKSRHNKTKKHISFINNNK